jgi:hypothetical protein
VKKSMSVLSELDAVSRRTLTICGLKQLLMLTAAAAFALGDPPSLLRFATLVELYTFIGGIAAVTCAIIRRQKPQSDVINHWDESLAFGALCLMAHIGVRALH